MLAVHGIPDHDDMPGLTEMNNSLAGQTSEMMW